MNLLSLDDLADGPEGTDLLLIDASDDCSPAVLSRASASAGRYNGPIVGIVTGALPQAHEVLAEQLASCMVGGAETARTTVFVQDLEAAAVAITETAKGSPAAAAVLVRLLRATEDLPVMSGLTCESLAYSLLLGGSEFREWRARHPRRMPAVDEEPVVQVRRDGDQLHVALHRPRRHNAFSAAVRDALIEALLVAELDGGISGVHLTGDGPSFCSGGDLAEFGTAQDLVAAHLLRVGQSAGAAVHRLRARVTAHLHGACIGAGIEIPAFAGRVVAADDTVIQLPELGMGLVPGAGGTVSLTHRAGRWRTAYLVLSGMEIDARTAQRWGIVDDLV